MLFFQLRRKKQRKQFIFLSAIAVILIVTAYASSILTQNFLNYRYTTRKSKADNTVIPQIYWGAYISGSTYGTGYGNTPWDQNTWNTFESHTHKKVSILHWGQPWYNSTTWPNGYYPFDPTLMDTVTSRGAIPMIDWSSWDISKGSRQPDFALRNIANGNTYMYGGQTYDAYITQWAQAAKAWGKPFFLRFNWEMNGWWKFPWATAADPNLGTTINDNTPQDYINAWRHVHDIFTQVGAHNVTWVWCPNISTASTMPLSQLYPGDGYVDWLCLDGYNNDMSNWNSFSQIFSGASNNGYHDSYTEITSLTGSKPLLIGEWATNEAGDGGTQKANWISDALLSQIPFNYPRIAAIVWFNWKSDPTISYAIESTTAAQNAFASAINANFYVAGDTALQLSSPIQPLPPLAPTALPTATVIPTNTPPPSLTPSASPTIWPSPTPTPRCCSYNKQGRCAKYCR